MLSPKKQATKNAYERPLPFPVYVYSPLNLEERNIFRKIVENPVFKKAIQNAHAQKPSTGAIGTGVREITENSTLIANNRLHQLQGWEMFEAALFGQAEERVSRTARAPQENYQAE